MSPDQIAALGALLSGLGSLVGGFIGLRISRKRGKDECEQRVKEVMKAFKNGMALEEEQRWSHLP